MFTKWNLKGFKSVRDGANLTIAPLTVFCGANSSGKSTIIQSILLTTQTVQSQIHTRSVVLNGHIVRLGNYNDILSNGSSDQMITIGFELKVTGNQDDRRFAYQRRYSPYGSLDVDTVKCAFTLSPQDGRRAEDGLQLYPIILKSQMDVTGTIEGKAVSEKTTLVRTAKTPNQRIEHLSDPTNSGLALDVSRFEYEVSDNPIEKSLRHYRFARYGRINNGKTIGANLNHFLPNQIAFTFDEIQTEVDAMVDAIFSPDPRILERDEEPSLDQSVINNMIDLISGSVDDPKIKDAFIALKQDFSFRKLLQGIRRMPATSKVGFIEKAPALKTNLKTILRADRGPIHRLAVCPLPGLTESSINYMNDFFANRVKYLGPLRDEPKAIYPLMGGIDRKDVGFKGENTAAVLEMYKNVVVSYIPTSEFSSTNSSRLPQNISLENAVLEWMQYVGVADKFQTQDKGKFGHELKVSISEGGDLHDLTHVGVGVSQVLPILVQSLLADSGSTLIFEQPELHLHPKVQTKLADFFISLIQLGKQCIIETHSEYLINRLRHRSAIADDDQISSKIVIYFASKQDRQSSYNPVEITKYGTIANWPAGFFDESDSLAGEIVNAGIAKKKKEKRRSIEAPKE